MGITVAAWRARIGSFAMPGVREKFMAPAIVVGGRVRMTLRLLTVVAALLLMAGVESNPGPRSEAEGKSTSATTCSKGPRTGANAMSQSRLSFDNSGGRMTRNSKGTPIPRSEDRHEESDKFDLIMEKLELLSVLDDRMGRIEEKLDEELFVISERVSDLEIGYKELQDKISSLEEQSRRDNLIFWGIPEKSGQENWDDCENSVRTFLTDTLKIDGAADDAVVTIERAHRLGKMAARGGKARGIIVKFGRWKHRQLVMEKAREVKDQDVRVSEDFSLRVRELRRKLVQHMIRARAEDSERRCYMRYDKLVIGDSVYTVNDKDVLTKIR